MRWAFSRISRNPSAERCRKAGSMSASGCQETGTRSPVRTELGDLCGTVMLLDHVAVRVRGGRCLRVSAEVARHGCGADGGYGTVLLRALAEAARRYPGKPRLRGY